MLPDPPAGLRSVRIEPHPSRYAEGSALISMGHTRVLCAVSVEDRVPDFLRGRAQGWLTAEYAMLPRATHTRGPRERAGGKPNSRGLEISRLVGRALRQAVDLSAVGERTLTLDCDVLDADGGTRCAAITGGCVALALALRKIAAAPSAATVPAADAPARDPVLFPPGLRRYVSAVSVGVVDGLPVLDLDYDQDHRAEVDLNVVLTDDGRYVELQGTAEHEPFPESTLAALRELARAGCAHLCRIQRETVRDAP